MQWQRARLGARTPRDEHRGAPLTPSHAGSMEPNRDRDTAAGLRQIPVFIPSSRPNNNSNHHPNANMRKHPIPEIVLQLACATHGLLQQELKRPRFQGGQIQERLSLGMLLILSQRRSFREQLLFRDYDQEAGEQWLEPVGKTRGNSDAQPSACKPIDANDAPKARLFRPALTYLELVLSRPLALAPKLADKPGSMHRLLQCLARHGPAADGWPAVRIERRLCAPARDHPPASFPAIASALSAGLERRKAGGEGDGADKKRGAFGPFWIIIPGAAAEVADDLTFWDCVKATPIPIEQELDNDSLNRLTDVLSSLNRRYALLRSCGLDPEHWDQDNSLSIDNLKQLKQLRETVQQRLSNPQTPAERPIAAIYAEAFKALKGDAAGFAGFDRFDGEETGNRRAFANSAVGQQMLHGALASLDCAIGDDHSPLLIETVSDDDIGDRDGLWPVEQQATREEDLARAIAECPGIRKDALLTWFAEQTILARRPIHGEGGFIDRYDNRITDQAFQALVDATDDYPGDDVEALLYSIQRKLDAAIRYYYNKCQNRD
jgi:hypothetical protein